MLAEDVSREVREALGQVQHDLFDLGGELSIPGHKLLKPSRVEALEETLEAWNAGLEPLKEFILPGGTRAAAAAHLARTVCRRAERSVVASDARTRSATRRGATSTGSPTCCSSPAACSTAHAGQNDVQWRHERKKT